MNNDKKTTVKQILDTIKATFDFSDIDEVEKHITNDFNFSMGDRVEVKKKQTMPLAAKLGVTVLIGSILCCGIEVSHNYVSNKSHVESTTEDKTLLGSIEDVLNEGLINPVKESLGIGVLSEEELVGGIVRSYEAELKGEKVDFSGSLITAQCFVQDTQNPRYNHDSAGKKISELNTMFKDGKITEFGLYTVYKKHMKTGYDNMKYFYQAAHNDVPGVFTETSFEDYITKKYKTKENYEASMEALRSYVRPILEEYAKDKGLMENKEKGK